ncbi:ComEC/Rec2 family competence protein [Alkalithermobacter paradoxus]|uniref:ComEC family competence protein n=1 Tax=Alkalithermobacter paradoxus TaxID=29349 RepID=A0A1V4I6K6_9FIRM|nr:ComEC family competence protein [[Clostridium] thermoalcaliphilum]
MISNVRRPILLVFCIGLLFVFVYTKIYKDPFAVHDKESVKISGIIKNIEYKDKYFQYHIGNILVRDFNKSENIKVGFKVDINGRFQSIDDLKFDDFDYGLYLKSKGYRGIVVVSSVKVIKEKNNIYYIANNFKNYIKERINLLYKAYSPFLYALILGDKTDIDKYIIDNFSKTGTSHIIALSGLHVGIIGGVLTFLTRGIKKEYRFILICTALIFYCFIVGFTPSIVRATIFIMMIYIASLIEREYDIICSLSLVGTLLIIKNPFIIYNLSFQLSFMAVLSISYFYKTIDKYVKYPLISVSLSASILTWPIIYYNYRIFSIISVLANLLILGVVGFIIILSITSILLSIINTNLAFLIANINLVFIKYILIIVEYLASVRYSHIEFNSSSLMLIVLYYIIISIYMIYKEVKTIKEQKNGVHGYNKGYEKRSI